MSFRKPLTRTQRSGGDYSRGKWAGESETTSTIYGSIQPATGRQRSNVPEGYDSTSALECITDTELTIAEAEGQRGDVITWNGDEYEVVGREPWQNDVLNHYAYILALPDNPTVRS